MKTCCTLIGLVCVSLIYSGLSGADLFPDKDARLREPITLNTLRTFPEVSSKADWLARATDIRQQILVSAGLWPMPDKAPLNAKIFGRTEHGDFSVEKVYIQTYPGFYLSGNLYRPLGKGKGPFPGVLNPHGHWAHGRLEDIKDGSIPARCISFARMGMVAFAYDMVGYNDTQFGDFSKDPGYKYHRTFGVNPSDLLWNISLMGLQTWNSVRALDFICSLPDVDGKRIGCTGASGGGTQTFMLGAIDDRLTALAPTVMVSHSMQGGCSCENMAGLRVEHSNMEIAAVPVPRPQIFVAATGDWTRAFMTIEGPAIAGIYKLFNAQDKARYKVLNFNHNYNQSTREEVYAFFGEYLLRASNPAALKEAPYPPASTLDLRVFPDGKPPQDTLTMAGLAAQLTVQAKAQLAALAPKDRATLKKYQDTLMPAWRHTLQVSLPGKNELASQALGTDALGSVVRTRLSLGRRQQGDRIPAILLEPAGNKAAVVLAHPAGRSAYLDAAGAPSGLAKTLLEQKCSVLLLDTFMTGEAADAAIAAKRAKQADLFFTCYNRTDAQERVQDLITACAYARTQTKGKVVLCGSGIAGLWALLAAPTADAVVADANAIDAADDGTCLNQGLFVPGLRKLGGFEGVAMLAAPKPMLLHNTGGRFKQDFLQSAYAGVRAAKDIQSQAQAVSESELAGWIVKAGK
jgi:dienelactone hydrolase